MRLADILFSCGVHAAVLAVALALPSQDAGPPPRVYEVSLAEFAPPAQPEPAPVSPRLPQPAVPEPPAPKAAPAPKPLPRTTPTPAVQSISPRKQEQAPAPPQHPAQETPTTAGVEPSLMQESVGTASAPASPSVSGARSRQSVQVGGMRAYEADAVDERPSVVRGVRPEYPDKARRRNIEGRVLVRVLIDTQGQPRDCAVQSAEPAGMFDEAAVSAACRHRFLPGRIDGRSVMTVVILPFSFVLR